jgi:integrase
MGRSHCCKSFGNRKFDVLRSRPGSPGEPRTANSSPHSFRRAVATVVRDALGPALAQQQLSHTKLATMEAHYLQRQTLAPDARDALEHFAGGAKKRESICHGRVARLPHRRFRW